MILRFPSALLFMAAFTGSLHAQPAFSRTKLVDANAGPHANATTIQDGIGLVPSDALERWTVLVYAGVYAENVLIPANKKNIDIVGVDPESVVINAPAGGAPGFGDGVIIEASGVKNVSIRNLTIKTNDDGVDEGRGIVVRRSAGGSAISGIHIEGVHVITQAANSNGIDIQDVADDLRLLRCTVETLSTNSHAFMMQPMTFSMLPPLTNFRVDNCRLITRGGTNPDAGGQPSHAMRLLHLVSGMRMAETYLGIEGSGGETIAFSSGGSDIDLSNVTVRSLAQSTGIEAATTTRLRLSRCDMLRHDGNALVAGLATEVDNSSIVVAKQPGGATSKDDSSLWRIGGYDRCRRSRVQPVRSAQ